MKSNCCNREKVKRKKEEVRREGARTGAVLRTFAFLLFTFYFLAWPAIGRSQSSYRRDRSDRFRRDDPRSSGSTRPDFSRPQGSTPPGSTQGDPRRNGSTPTTSTKQDAARPATGQPTTSRITAPAEPNRARPVERHMPRPVVQDGQYKAKYEIITQRNMFSRERVPVQQQRQAVERPRTIPNPESYLLLKGIAQENNQFIAFVEDKRTGSVLRLREGDTVARGMVKSLTLDGLEYQFQGKTTAVRMGSDLEGGIGAVTAADLASLTPSAAPAAGSSPAPTADEAEILKRLMEKRQQEMGK